MEPNIAIVPLPPLLEARGRIRRESRAKLDIGPKTARNFKSNPSWTLTQPESLRLGSSPKSASTESNSLTRWPGEGPPEPPPNYRENPNKILLSLVFATRDLMRDIVGGRACAVVPAYFLFRVRLEIAASRATISRDLIVRTVLRNDSAPERLLRFALLPLRHNARCVIFEVDNKPLFHIAVAFRTRIVSFHDFSPGANYLPEPGRERPSRASEEALFFGLIHRPD